VTTTDITISPDQGTLILNTSKNVSNIQMIEPNEYPDDYVTDDEAQVESILQTWEADVLDDNTLHGFERAEAMDLLLDWQSQRNVYDQDNNPLSPVHQIYPIDLLNQWYELNMEDTIEEKGEYYWSYSNESVATDNKWKIMEFLTQWVDKRTNEAQPDEGISQWNEPNNSQILDTNRTDIDGDIFQSSYSMSNNHSLMHEFYVQERTVQYMHPNNTSSSETQLKHILSDDIKSTENETSSDLFLPKHLDVSESQASYDFTSVNNQPRDALLANLVLPSGVPVNQLPEHIQYAIYQNIQLRQQLQEQHQQEQEQEQQQQQLQQHKDHQQKLLSQQQYQQQDDILRESQHLHLEEQDNLPELIQLKMAQQDIQQTQQPTPQPIQYSQSTHQVQPNMVHQLIEDQEQIHQQPELPKQMEGLDNWVQLEENQYQSLNDISNLIYPHAQQYDASINEENNQQPAMKDSLLISPSYLEEIKQSYSSIEDQLKPKLAKPEADLGHPKVHDLPPLPALPLPIGMPMQHQLGFMDTKARDELAFTTLEHVENHFKVVDEKAAMHLEINPVDNASKESDIDEYDSYLNSALDDSEVHASKQNSLLREKNDEQQLSWDTHEAGEPVVEISNVTGIPEDEEIASKFQEDDYDTLTENKEVKFKSSMGIVKPLSQVHQPVKVETVPTQQQGNKWNKRNPNLLRTNKAPHAQVGIHRSSKYFTQYSGRSPTNTQSDLIGLVNNQLCHRAGNGSSPVQYVIFLKMVA
jgi:hypothetical protein